MSVGILVVCSTGVGQSAEQTPLAELASHWDTFKANVGTARHEARLQLAALASERDARSLDADRFNERLAAFARTSPVWAAYSWPVAELAKMPTVWFEPWDRVLLLEPNAEQRAIEIEAQLDARTRALTTPDPTACFDQRSKFTPSISTPVLGREPTATSGLTRSRTEAAASVTSPSCRTVRHWQQRRVLP